MFYSPPFNQPNCKKVSPYQLPFNKGIKPAKIWLSATGSAPQNDFPLKGICPLKFWKTIERTIETIADCLKNSGLLYFPLPSFSSRKPEISVALVYNSLLHEYKPTEKSCELMYARLKDFTAKVTEVSKGLPEFDTVFLLLLNDSQWSWYDWNGHFHLSYHVV